jgi:hypothetical protein
MGHGWAYVGLPDTAGAQGPNGAVQYHTGSGGLSGSKAFVVTDVDIGVPGDTARIAISGTLTVDGIISASHLHIENVTEIDATGSTFFGNTNDDIHARTGSFGVSNLTTTVFFATASANASVPMVGIGLAPASFSGSGLVVAGNISASQGITASAFFGDAQYLTNAGDPKQFTADTDGTAYIYATASTMVGAATVPQNSAVFEVGGTGLANIPVLTSSTGVSASAVYGGRLMIGSQIGNTANHTTIAGGQFNEASANYAAVLGGFRNRATAIYTVVGGGIQNTASYQYATIAGGSTNKAMAQYSTVAGGYQNRAEQGSAFVGGGDDNKAGAAHSTIGGGQYNTVVGTTFKVATHGVVAGGYANTSSAQYCTIAGGDTNRINWGAHYGGILGGHGNTVTGQYSSVLGGRWNKAGANYAAVIGGSGSEATGQGSIVIGSNLTSSATDAIILGGGAASPSYVIQLSGAVQAAGDITASIGVKASFFEGDGSRLTGISASPGGADTQVQFNDGGSAFGADSGFTYNESGTAKLSTGLDIVSDGNFNLLTTVGAANTITVGGVNSIVNIIGSLTVADDIQCDDIAAVDIAGTNISGSGQVSGSSFVLYSEALGPVTNTLDLTAPNARGTYLQLRNRYSRVRLTGSAIEVSGALHNDQGITIGSDQFQTTLGVSGSISAGVRRVTGNWTVDNAGAHGYDDYIIGVSASGPVQISLPDAAQYQGRTLIIKDEYGNGGTARLAQNAITASTAGTGNYIERQPLTTYYLYGSSQGSFTLYSDGINVWYVI